MEDNGVHLTSMIFCPSLNFEPCSTVFKCSVTVGHRSAVYMGGGDTLLTRRGTVDVNCVLSLRPTAA